MFSLICWFPKLGHGKGHRMGILEEKMNGRMFMKSFLAETERQLSV